MKKHIYIFLLFTTALVFGQTDFSNQWQDLYSYNNVKDFTIAENKLYAVSNNAMFIYDIDTNDTQKFSSVNGLSGSTTSSVSYDETSLSIVIGYENGLIEIISENNTVVPVTGIRDNIILVDKIVNGFYGAQNQSYVFGDFGIVELDIDAFEFGDTYKMSNTNSSNTVNQILQVNNVLYAATVNGLYNINISALNPKDFNNWTLVTTGVISDMIEINGFVYFTKENQVYEISNPLVSLINESSVILNINNTQSNIVVTTESKVMLYNNSTLFLEDEIDITEATSHPDFTILKGFVYNNSLFTSTSNYGVLKTELSDRFVYSEIHPDGPSRNDSFFITVKNSNILFSYGGWNNIYNFNEVKRELGISIFNQNKWYNIPYADIGIVDITKIEVDPLNPNKIYIPSYFNGVVVMEYNENLDSWEKITVWNPDSTNNGIQETVVSLSSDSNAIISYLAIDNNNMLWVSSLFSKNYEFLSRYNPNNDNWETLVDFSSLFNVTNNDVRIHKMVVNADGNIFCGTKSQGMIVFKETYDQSLSSNNDNNQIQVLNTESSKGALPSNNVRAIVADENNLIWIGTNLGLVVFNDYDNLYNSTKNAASTLVFEENEIPKELLANTQINDIIIDLSGNKWFATAGGGVVQTSSDGKTTYNTFNTSNSPLPDDTIIDLELDKDTGLIYMVTEKGTLSYDSKNEPFGTNITSIIAYPNPAVRNLLGHENITIVAKDGNGIPDGTNVKIMDVSGKLVYETNVNSFSSALGGKIVWDKKNLRGNSVVSGVYIVLLSNSDGSETTTTKIAIVN